MDSNKPEQNEKTRTVRNTHSNDNLEKKKKRVERWNVTRTRNQIQFGTKQK